MPETLSIAGREYRLISKQRSLSAVYKSPADYLRIGEPTFIDAKLLIHKRMEQEGFPVPHLLGEGMHHQWKYFTEESLGEKRLTDLFAEDMQFLGKISEPHFDQFVAVTLRFLEAQLRTAQPLHDDKVFGQAVHLENMLAELPDHATRIAQRFAETLRHTFLLPSVVTHGDFNPTNMYPAGVIDFEDSFHGPVGFDMISAVTTIDWFPQTAGYEYQAKYSFTDAQRKEYLAGCDDAFMRAGLPALSGFFDDFAFARALWVTARMHDFPKLQQWRYEKFISLYL